jgi:hypothetical protein
VTDGKLTSKPSDALRKKLAKRAKDQMQLVQAMNADNKVDTYGVLNKPSPSEKRSKAWKKKMRTRDDRKIPYDFQEPEPISENVIIWGAEDDHE